MFCCGGGYVADFVVVVVKEVVEGEEGREVGVVIGGLAGEKGVEGRGGCEAGVECLWIV